MRLRGEKRRSRRSTPTCTTTSRGGAAVATSNEALFHYDKSDFTRFPDVPENDAVSRSTSRDRHQYARRIARDPASGERKRLRAMWDAWLTARRTGRDVGMPPVARAR